MGYVSFARRRLSSAPAWRAALTRRRLHVIAPLERLQLRLLPAVVTPFTSPFSTIANGNIALIGNTVVTAPASNPNATNAQNGVGSFLDWYQFNPMANVNVVGVSVTNASSATLNMPAGSTVLFAGLFWGGFSKGFKDTDLQTVRLATPTSGGSFTTLVAPAANLSGPAGVKNDEYAAWINVTSQVGAAGNGVYTVANVATEPTAGTKRYGGWSLVVAYGNPADPPRSLTVFNGFAIVPGNNNVNPVSRTVGIPISGFVTPPSGAVNAQLGFVSYDGSLGKSADSLSLNGATLSDATRPANNFFNSSITDLGSPVTAKNPNFVNQIGFDIGTVDASGILANGATSTLLTAVGEQTSVSNIGYNPQVFTLAIQQLASPTLSTIPSPSSVTLSANFRDFRVDRFGHARRRQRSDGHHHLHAGPRRHDGGHRAGHSHRRQRHLHDADRLHAARHRHGDRHLPVECHL